MTKDLFTSIWHLPRRLAIATVKLYQATLSPDHGPLQSLHPHGFCRHHPTCSDYGISVLRRRGFVVGSLLSIIRIVSCNPWKKPSDEKIRAAIAKQLHRES